VEDAGFTVGYEGVREGKAFTRIRFAVTKTLERDDRDEALQRNADLARRHVRGGMAPLIDNVSYNPPDHVLEQLRTLAPGWDRHLPRMLTARLSAGLKKSRTVSRRDLAGISRSTAETIDVKYYGKLDLAPFACTDISRSSFINRACYDQSKQFMVVQLRSVYYPYCELPPAIFDAFLAAPSMGRYYNANIKGSGVDGPFDCRTHVAPTRQSSARGQRFIRARLREALSRYAANQGPLTMGKPHLVPNDSHADRSTIRSGRTANHRERTAARKALAKVIADRDHKRRALQQAETCIENARQFVWDAEAQQEQAATAVKAARDHHRQLVTKAAISGSRIPSDQTVRDARIAEIDAADRLQVAKDALATLQNLGPLKDALEFTEVSVENAAMAVIKDEVQHWQQQMHRKRQADAV
jgi:hypothetical protein